jgi:recombination protein RecT
MESAKGATGTTGAPADQKQETGLQAVKTLLNSDGIKARFEQMLGKKAGGFITSVLQIVSSNKDLQACDLQSIYNAAATAAVLDLPLNNNLQFAHLIPYKDHKRGGMQFAQFQMGWRGFVQLAQRSGQFSTINVTDVREGELKSRDRLTGECVFLWEQDEEKRKVLPLIGFISYFRLINGFQKSIYRSVTELRAHAARYSKTYNREDSKWNTDFDAMCCKTVLKENLNKYAPLSVEMATAIQYDQAIIRDDKVEYLDNPFSDAQELSDEEAAEIERITREDQAKQAELDLEGKLKKDDKKDGKK